MSTVLAAALLLAGLAYPVGRVLRRPVVPPAPATLDPPAELTPALAASLLGAGKVRRLKAAFLELLRRGEITVEPPGPSGQARGATVIRSRRTPGLPPWQDWLLNGLGLEAEGSRIDLQARAAGRGLVRSAPQSLRRMEEALLERRLIRMDSSGVILWRTWIGVQLWLALSVAALPPLPRPWGLLPLGAAVVLLLVTVHRWRLRGGPPAALREAPGLGLAGLAALGLWGLGLNPGRWLGLPPMVAVLVAAYLLLWVPILLLPVVERRTRAGLEAWGRLQGLAAGLGALEDLDRVPEARRRLDELLPWAVALGVEASFLEAVPLPDDVLALPGWFLAPRRRDRAGPPPAEDRPAV